VYERVPGMTRLWFLLVFTLGCAAAPPGPTTPCAPQGPPAALAAAPPSIAPDRLAYWRSVKAKGLPGGTTAESQLPELVGFLGSPDPELRDGIGYEVLHAWIVEKRLLDAGQLRALTATLLANLAAPHDTAPDAVLARSFSALAMSLVAAREVATPYLTPDELHAMVGAAATYAATERDLRGHIGAQGWAHAAAHTADWLNQLAKNPALTHDDAAAILRAVADLTVRRHGQILAHGEDSRLAAPVMTLLRRDRIDQAAWAPWVDGLLAPFREPGFEPARYAAQRNGRNLLFTLFVFLSLEEKPSPSMQMALPVVRAAIAS
jgi:hypothetical protein